MEAVRCETLRRQGSGKTGLKVSSLSSTDEDPPPDSDGSHRTLCPVSHAFSHQFEHGRVLLPALGTPFRDFLES